MSCCVPRWMLEHIPEQCRGPSAHPILPMSGLCWWPRPGRSCPAWEGLFGQTSGSNMNALTSCGQRQAAAIFAAHSKAASREGTSMTVMPPSG
jgi:hypothetical protein